MHSMKAGRQPSLKKASLWKMVCVAIVLDCVQRSSGCLYLLVNQLAHFCGGVVLLVQELHAKVVERLHRPVVVEQLQLPTLRRGDLAQHARDQHRDRSGHEADVQQHKLQRKRQGKALRTLQEQAKPARLVGNLRQIREIALLVEKVVDRDGHPNFILNVLHAGQIVVPAGQRLADCADELPFSFSLCGSKTQRSGINGAMANSSRMLPVGAFEKLVHFWCQHFGHSLQRLSFRVFHSSHELRCAFKLAKAAREDGLQEII
mmetsp:Transcript_11615/g.43322  ORF Transcript_11615/g.43322 Transcript_11615/m.43322 type:complete len:261 (-) Transcript_11615:504-1286(-)